MNFVRKTVQYYVVCMPHLNKVSFLLMFLFSFFIPLYILIVIACIDSVENLFHVHNQSTV